MKTKLDILLISTCFLFISGCKFEEISGASLSTTSEPGNFPAMIPVTGGTFLMGSSNVVDKNASPVHSVTVGSFNIDKYEITYERWTEVRTWARSHGYTDLPAGQHGSNPNGENNPVTYVSWYDAVKWCNARSEMNGCEPVYFTNDGLTIVYRTGVVDLGSNVVNWTANGYRLPTEAEWEYAAKGGVKAQSPTPYIYSGSNTIDDVAWYYRKNSYMQSNTVGTKMANELGIYDMSGNVWEWCWDWYGAYASSAQTDPRGPSTRQADRVLRGGGFTGLEYVCRSASRAVYSAPSFRYNPFGFRCVRKSLVGTLRTRS